MRNPITSTKTPEYDLFLDVLRKAREDSGVGQRKLGRLLGRDQSFISKVERGDRRLDVVELIQYCEHIGTPASMVVLRTENAIKAL